jgi:cytoskeletal protein RodZ
MSGEPPRKRLPASVYRRRRIVLAIVIVALGALVWVLIAQPWRVAAAESAAPAPSSTRAAATDLPVPEEAAPDPTPTSDESPDAASDATPTAAPSPEASPSPEATPSAQPCVARDITVEAVTDQDTYSAGQNPQLSIRLTNTGASDCTLNVGTSGQAFTIMSGTDVWWRSTDCQQEPSDMVVLLAAGQAVSSAAPLTWDRTRSAVDTCGESARQSAPGGGASYHLSVEIGGISSTQSKQLLLY